MKESRIIPLKCPNCQSSECTELGNDTYRCNFCKTNFVYRKDSPQVVNNTTIYNTGTPQLRLKPVLVGVAIFMLLMVVVPLIVIFLGGNKGNNSGVFESSGETGNVEYAIPVPHKKGVYVWTYLSRRNWKGNDCTYQGVLKIIDPRSGKVLEETVLSDSESSYNSVRSKPLEFGAGKCWALLENGVKAFDPDNFQEVENNKTLSLRHKELSEGLLKCDFDDYGSGQRALVINTKDGNKFYYILDFDIILTANEYDESRYKTDCISKYTYQDQRAFFGFKNQQNSKKEILIKDDKRPVPIMPYSTSKMEDEGYSLTPDRVYFFPKVHYFDKKRLVISYLNDADEKNSPRIIQCLSADNGKVLWTCAENDIQRLPSSMYWVRTAVGGSGNDEQIVFCSLERSVKKEKCRSVGISMNTGQILFTQAGEE